VVSVSSPNVPSASYVIAPRRIDWPIAGYVAALAW
jgi:hypothetical protein